MSWRFTHFYPYVQPEPVVFVDPLNGEEIRVRSVCFPSKTLLQGKEYTRANGQLGQLSLPSKPKNGTVQ